MFERFTDGARRCVVAAQEEARRLDHSCIGTEHLLLGLAHDDGIAGQVLTDRGLTLEMIRAGVTAIVGTGGGSPEGHIAFTPRAKKVLELSLREAIELRSNSIGSEHVLLGLLREGEGVAVQVLATHLGGDPRAVVRQAVLAHLPTRTIDTRPGSDITFDDGPFLPRCARCGNPFTEPLKAVPTYVRTDSGPGALVTLACCPSCGAAVGIVPDSTA